MERKTHHPSGFGFCRLLVEFFTKQHQLHTADLKSHTIACVALWKISSISFFQFTASVCLSTLTSHARLSLNGLQAQFAELVRARGICTVMGRQTASKSSDSLSLTAHAVLNSYHYCMWFRGYSTRFSFCLPPLWSLSRTI